MKKRSRMATVILVFCLCLLLAGCQSKEAKGVDAAIDGIGDVTLDSEETIRAVREAYDALSEKDRQSLKNTDLLLQAEETLLILKIDDALEKLDNEKLFEFKTAYDAIEEEYLSLTADRQEQIVNYMDLEKAYEKWLGKMRPGVLGPFAEILQSDFNPSWNISFDDLVNNYNGQISTPQKDSEDTEDSESSLQSCYFSIKLKDNEYECACAFRNGEMIYCALGNYDFLGKSASNRVDILTDFVEDNVKYDEKLPIRSTLTLSPAQIGTVYILDSGRTIFIYTGGMDKVPILMLLPTKVNNADYLLITGHIVEWDLRMAGMVLHNPLPQ